MLLGIFLGLVFGGAVAKIDALHVGSIRKGVGLGVVLGLITIPLGCVPTALLSGVPVLEFIGFSTIPHPAWGVVPGAIAGYALRPNPGSAA